MEIQEIIDLASQFEDPSKFIDIPKVDDVFFVIAQNTAAPKTAKFAGYFICRGYETNYDSNIKDKHINIHCYNLSIFPPTQQTFTMQPPHIALGCWQSADRSVEYRMRKLEFTIEQVQQEVSKQQAEQTNASSETSCDEKILKFRTKKEK